MTSVDLHNTLFECEITARKGRALALALSHEETALSLPSDDLNLAIMALCDHFERIAGTLSDIQTQRTQETA